MRPPNLPMGRIPLDAVRMRWKDADGREEKFTDCDFKVWGVADFLMASRTTFPPVAEIAEVADVSERAVQVFFRRLSGSGLATIERDHWGRITRVALNYSLQSPDSDEAEGGRA